LPAEARPLFRPDALGPRLTDFSLPAYVETAKTKLDHWCELITSGRADSHNETQLLPDFITDIFLNLLGYRGPAGGHSRYTLSREQHVQVDGKFADAVLGEFGEEPAKFIAALEGKSSRDPLDRPFAGRRMSAVDQAYRYAINLPCDWIIVTNLREIRLYFKGRDQYTFERFDLQRLRQDEASLKRFVFLLGAERVVPPEGRCHLYDLLGDSERLSRELTRKYYTDYARMRQKAFERLSSANPDVAAPEILGVTQKLLDRVLFCAFSEARGLLPADTIANAYRHTDPYNPRPIWDNFKGLFRAIDEGNPRLDIPQYNGGLFERNELLERLQVPDEVCKPLPSWPSMITGPLGKRRKKPRLPMEPSSLTWISSVTSLSNPSAIWSGCEPGWRDSLPKKNPSPRHAEKRKGLFTPRLSSPATSSTKPWGEFWRIVLSISESDMSMKLRRPRDPRWPTRRFMTSTL
jgi:hypothetical protein